MAALSAAIEGGKSHKEAVVDMFKENRNVIFTGNGYSDEWPVEAVEKRGLPNLKTTPVATAEFASEKNVKLLEDMKIYEPAETKARSIVMYENYVTTLCIEVETMVGGCAVIPFRLAPRTRAPRETSKSDCSSRKRAATMPSTALDARRGDAPR